MSWQKLVGDDEFQNPCHEGRSWCFRPGASVGNDTPRLMALAFATTSTLKTLPCHVAALDYLAADGDSTAVTGRRWAAVSTSCTVWR